MAQRIKGFQVFRPRFEFLENRTVLAAFIQGPIVQNTDFVGYDASSGPDGKSDISFVLNGLLNTDDIYHSDIIISADITATFANNGGAMQRRYGDNPKGFPRAEIIRVLDNSSINSSYPYRVDEGTSLATVVICTQPAGKTISQINVILNYANGTTDNSPFTTDGSLVNIVPGQNFSRPGGAVVTKGGKATFQPGQYPTDDDSWNQKAGDSHITLDSLPAGFTYSNIVELSLSDGKSSPFASGDATHSASGGTIWSNAAKYYAARLSSRAAPGSQPGYVADIAVPPIRDELGATMTLRMVLHPASGPD